MATKPKPPYLVVCDHCQKHGWFVVLGSDNEEIRSPGFSSKESGMELLGILMECGYITHLMCLALLQDLKAIVSIANFDHEADKLVAITVVNENESSIDSFIRIQEEVVPKRNSIH